MKRETVQRGNVYARGRDDVMERVMAIVKMMNLRGHLSMMSEYCQLDHLHI